MQQHEDGFALPAEVRRVRAWWLRYAREHVHAARTKSYEGTNFDAKWHLGQAVQGRAYARGVVEHYLSRRSVER